MKTSPAEYKALLRQDLPSFIQRCFYELHPNTDFLWNYHIAVIASVLEECRQKKKRRVIINLPPRSLKSLCASIAFPAWLLGHDPSAQIICVSYAQDLADKHSRDCRSVVSAPWYKRVFPTRLSGSKQSFQEFVTTGQGFRLASSIGGVLTGRGADYIIIDDPLKPEEALSIGALRRVNEWYAHTLLSRLNDKETGCIIIIMQRLHEDDLVGFVTSQEGWEIVSFPAIAERDEIRTFQTLLGPRRHVRRVGEALHPARKSLPTLERIRAQIGSYHFAGQYQQTPAPLGGGLIQENWFPRYDPRNLPERFDQILQSWDTANKPTELSDYSACVTFGSKGKRLYVLHVLRKRLDYPDLKRAVRAQANLHEPHVILIEDRASGTQLIQELGQEGLRGVRRFNPQGPKIMRMNSHTDLIENGLMYLPVDAPWLEEFMHELTTFPKGRFDDQTDAVSQALEWLRGPRLGRGFLDLIHEKNSQPALNDGSDDASEYAILHWRDPVTASLPVGIVQAKRPDVARLLALGYELSNSTPNTQSP